jgi:hypothetical protein
MKITVGLPLAATIVTCMLFGRITLGFGENKMDDNSAITLANYSTIMKSRFLGWDPPGKDYGFTWADTREGVYQGKPYYHPGGILIKAKRQRFGRVPLVVENQTAYAP